MNFVLVLFIHAGMLAHTNDVSVTTARFYNRSACMDAGNAAKSLTSGTVQNVEYACIEDDASATTTSIPK